MDTPPDRRFVRLRHADADQQHVTTTFVSADASRPPTLETNGVLAGIAETDPARARLILERLRTLIAHNHEMMTWLEADGGNAVLFARDPVAAVRQALPDLPADFFEGWGTVEPKTS